MKHAWSILFALSVAQMSGRDAEAQASAKRAAAIFDLARLYGTVRYFHPAVLQNPGSWDSLTAVAVDSVLSGSARGAQRAPEQLLAALHDPMTRITHGSAVRFGSTPVCLAISGMGSGVLYARARPASRAAACGTRRKAAKPWTIRDSALIVDLRPRRDALLAHETTISLDALLESIPRATIATRHIQYNGLPPTHSPGQSVYSTRWDTVIYHASASTDLSVAARVAFITDSAAGLPIAAAQVRAAGHSVIIAIGPAALAGGPEEYEFVLHDGRVAHIRTSDLIATGDGRRVAIDTVLQHGAVDAPAALQLAKAWIAGRWTPHSPSEVGATERVLRPIGTEGGESEGAPSGAPTGIEACPPTGMRVVGSFAVWATMHFFEPYLALAGEDWDAAFRTELPRFIAARNAEQYTEATLRLVAHIHDSHTYVAGPATNAVFGSGAPAIVTRYVQDSLVVTQYLDTAAATRALHAGDVVVAIDGRPTSARIQQLTPLLSASTPQAMNNLLGLYALRGDSSVPARLAIHRPSGDLTVVLPRRALYAAFGRRQRTGAVIRTLDSGIVYVDLDRLQPTGVDQMFDAIRTARGVIFDMRGYPFGTAWLIAPRLARGEVPAAALIRRPRRWSPDAHTWSDSVFEQHLPVAAGAGYNGRTLMLIDERTGSQAEHTGLFLEVANGTQFVGSPSAGVDGDQTGFAIPGGITVYLSGEEIRHADGRRLQRVGLQPTCWAAPTVDDMRRHRDPVVTAAVQYLMQGRCSRDAAPDTALHTHE